MPRPRARTAALIGAAVAASLVLLGAAAPWLIGLRIEHRYDQTLAALRDRGYQVVSDGYRRGWLTARAETVIAPPRDTSPDAAGAASPRLRLGLRVTHGPRGDAWSRWPPLLASARARLTVLGGPRRLPPLRIQGWLSADGRLETDLTLPDVTYSGAVGRLHLVEVGGRLWTHAQRRGLSGDGGIRALEAVDADGRRLALAGFGSQFALTDADGLPAGTVTLTLAKAALTGDVRDGARPLPPFHAAGVQLRLITRREGGRFGLTAVLGIDRLRIEDTPLAPLRLGLSLSGLVADALVELRSARAKPARRAVPETRRGLGVGRLLSEHLPALLARGPMLSIAPLSLTTAQGPLTAELALTLPAAGADGAQSPADPARWLARVEGGGRLEVPRALLLELLAQHQRRRALDELARRGEGGARLPPALEDQLTAAAEAALAGLLRQGWLVPAGGPGASVLRADVSIGDGVLSINERKLPLAGLVP